MAIHEVSHIISRPRILHIFNFSIKENLVCSKLRFCLFAVSDAVDPIDSQTLFSDPLQVWHPHLKF